VAADPEAGAAGAGAGEGAAGPEAAAVVEVTNSCSSTH
jgi:hypothetical protein